jgi:uncharacterized delta-60 repeat protein
MHQSHFAARNRSHIRFDARRRVKHLLAPAFVIIVGAALAFALQPGSLSFSTDSYSVSEAAGNATITVRRTGGTDDRVAAKVTLTNVTASAADYRFAPGAVDTSFNYGFGTGAGGSVRAVALQSDGKIIIGGSGITSYNGDANASDNILRLNADGTLDTSFNYGSGKGTNGSVSAIALQPDGKIIIGGFFGGFTSYNGDANAGDRLARLNADGTLDTSFNYGGLGANMFVGALAVQPDGKILAGGQFTSYNGDANASDFILRLNEDGTLDTSFNYGPGKGVSSSVSAIALQADEKIIIGGFFGGYNGDANASDCVARLNPDGTLDTSFSYGSGKGAGGGDVSAIALQPDGEILIGGNFTDYDGDANASNGIARLNSDGTLDTAFNYGSNAGVMGCCGSPLRPPIRGRITTVAQQPDGKIFIGGEFFGYNGIPNGGGRFARLSADGALETYFSIIGSVNDIDLQPDGKILFGGSSDRLNGDTKTSDGIARLDGDLFATWEAGDASDKTIQLPIVDDLLDEGNETLTLTLIPLIGGASAGTPSTATFTIIDNDLTISQVSGMGITEETATLTARLTSGGAPLSGKTVNFSLFGTSAGQAATDANGVATLSNVSLAGITVDRTYPDAVGAAFAGDAVFAAKSGTGTLTVIPPRLLQLSSASYSFGEGAGRAAITVSRSVATVAASVQYATSDASGLDNCNVNTGNASARCDYTAAGGTLIFAPGESSKTFTIPIVNDVFVEGSETLTVMLSNATGNSLSTPSSATVTIEDDDAAAGAPNPIDTREFFVRQLYLDTLNREPEPAGLAAWLNRLNTCPLPGETLQNCDEIEVASAFFRSPEAFDRSYFLYKFYEGSLIRQPQYEEFQNDVRRLTGFLTTEELEQRKREFAEEFVNRAEFRALYDSFGSGQPFVDAVLARAGAARPGVGAATVTTANRISVINRLSAGQITRGQALRELMEAPEISGRFFNKAFVVVGYFSFLRRNPDAAYLHWINVLNTTGDYREMIRGLMQSAEYRSRFGPV